MNPLIIASPIVVVVSSVALYARQRVTVMKRRKNIELLRLQYKRALNSNSSEAYDLGMAYYTAAGNGNIRDVDRKKVEYAVNLMKMEKKGLS